MIYPSPFSSDHYVVVNSGHTFHADDFKGTNALVYPRPGDHAMLRLLSATGMRVGELVTVDVGDISFGNGRVRVVGRGNRERLLPLDQAEE